MRAVTFQAPGEVLVEEVPEPEIIDSTDAIVRIEASGVCGSDLHIYHGRVKIDPGFTIGHEYVGTVTAIGDDVRNVALGMSDDVALFAGDVMGTGYHAAAESGLQAGDAAAVLGLGPVGLCAVQAAFAVGAAHVVEIDTVPERLAMAASFGAQAVHLTEDDPRAAVRAATEGRGVDACIDAVGDPRALELAIRLTRKCGTVQAIGVYAERCEVHMGLFWIKALGMRSGHANVIGHVDQVLELMSSGRLDPTPLVTHHMSLEQAPEAYALYDRREALKLSLIHISEPTRRTPISYAVFCLKKKKK